MENNLQYPVLVKLEIGQKSTYAHTFFCVNNRAGMRDALDFIGFQNVNVLCQAYLPHREKVYKIYGIGPFFRAPGRRSIPDTLMRSKDSVQFDS